MTFMKFKMYPKKLPAIVRRLFLILMYNTDAQ